MRAQSSTCYEVDCEQSEPRSGDIPVAVVHKARSARYLAWLAQSVSALRFVLGSDKNVAAPCRKRLRSLSLLSENCDWESVDVNPTIVTGQPYDEEKTLPLTPTSAARRLKNLQNQAQAPNRKLIPARPLASPVVQEALVRRYSKRPRIDGILAFAFRTRFSTGF